MGLSLTWYLIGHDRRGSGLVASDLLVVYNVTALGHSVIDHVQGVGHIRYAHHSQSYQICLFHHHLLED